MKRVADKRGRPLCLVRPITGTVLLIEHKKNRPNCVRIVFAAYHGDGSIDSTVPMIGLSYLFLHDVYLHGYGLGLGDILLFSTRAVVQGDDPVECVTLRSHFVGLRQVSPLRP